MRRLNFLFILVSVILISCQSGMQNNRNTSKNECRSEEVLPLITSIKTGLYTSSTCIIGQISGQAIFVIQGHERDFESKNTSATIKAFNPEGKLLWRNAKESNRNSISAGAYIHWIDDSKMDYPMVTYSYTGEGKAEGALVFVNANNGSSVIEIANNTHFGNNPSIIYDFNNDGFKDYIYGDQSTLSAIELPSYRKNWTYEDGIRFCWSLPAIHKQEGALKPVIYFGSEYDGKDESSSFSAIDINGNQIWKSGNHSEDLGSTPVFVADIDGDGRKELLKVGLDLEHRNKQEWNHLHIFNTDGKLIAKHPLGFTGIAIGDVDNDGLLDGVGIYNSRDGGLNGLKQIRCIELLTGKEKWAIPVERVYLDCNSPIMADINNDGYLEALVGTGNPSGYGRLPDSQPWGDLYVVSHDGKIIKREQLDGWPVNMGICDYNDDGQNEIFVVLDGAPGNINVYSTKEKARRKDWPVPFGNQERSGTHAY